VPPGPASNTIAYDGMNDEEFVADVEVALKAAQRRQTAILLRLLEELLERTKAETRRRGMPYQTLTDAAEELIIDYQNALGAYHPKLLASLVPELR
jgi:predicted DNA binding CopG/RHH family protein